MIVVGMLGGTSSSSAKQPRTSKESSSKPSTSTSQNPSPVNPSGFVGGSGPDAQKKSGKQVIVEKNRKGIPSLLDAVAPPPPPPPTARDSTSTGLLAHPGQPQYYPPGDPAYQTVCGLTFRCVWAYKRA